MDRVGWFGMTGDKAIVGDWTGDGKKKIGLFPSSTGMWILDLNGDVGWNGLSVDRLGWLGQNGDTPLSGRW